MNGKKILLLILRSEDESAHDNGRIALNSIEAGCKSLSETLDIEVEVSVLTSSENVCAEIQELSLGADALIVNNEDYAESPDGFAIEELRGFEAVAERGIPIVEVHEQNIFSDSDSRPYLDSPRIGAGLVSGMNLGSYTVAVRSLASKLGSKTV